METLMSDVQKILNFFDGIGLSYQLTELSEKSFLPGIEIQAGGLNIDLEKLKYPGDLLHEAGHIAVTAAHDRPKLSGDMKDLGHTGAEETAAIAWSYAACKHLNFAPELVFHPQGYRGAADNLISAFETGGGFGFPLLSYWDMCEPIGQPNGYPIMKTWLRSE